MSLKIGDEVIFLYKNEEKEGKIIGKTFFDIIRIKPKDEQRIYSISRESVKLKGNNMTFNIGDKVEINMNGYTYDKGEITNIYDTPKNIYDVKIDECIIPVDGKFLKLIENKIEFPKDFYKWNGVDVSNDQINVWIKELKNNKDITTISSGNTIIIKENEKLYVAKDYWEIDLNEE